MKGEILIPYFFDTCTLLRLQERAFDNFFYVCSKTFQELEEIKTSNRKDAEVKAQARNLLRLFVEHIGKYEIYPVTMDTYDEIVLLGLNTGNDNEIIACASLKSGKAPLKFATDDVACYMIATSCGLETEFRPLEENKTIEYKGYKTVTMNEEEMASFYSNLCVNTYGLLRNEYLRVADLNGRTVEVRKWDGTKYTTIYDKGIKSLAFGSKLKARDEYQAMAIDSIMSNTFTVLSGKAGSGKSLIALASLFTLIEKGVYDRLVIFANPCKVQGAVDMGFYTGSAVEKLMQNSIGNILTSKFGDRYLVDQMIMQDRIKLISVADCRGCEVRDNEILYVTEAQNMSIAMVKLLLSRASQGCKVVLEGDFDAQVDSWLYDGVYNGMRRIVDTFKGEEIFGYVELPNIWRSKLAELAQKL